MAVLTNEDVAAKVRGVAGERRESQASLAPVIGTSRMAMSRRFKGETPFTPEELIKLAAHMHTTVSVFFGERGA